MTAQLPINRSDQSQYYLDAGFNAMLRSELGKISKSGEQATQLITNSGVYFLLIFSVWWDE